MIAWALFDPNQGYPSHFSDPPAIFEQFATFKPGNARILEYNIHSQSVRLKSTPPFLQQGKGIEYTRTGPRIVEVAVKRPRGRPRKHPLPVNGVANVIPKIDRAVSTKIGRPVGRPRKTKVLESGESDVEEKDGSESPLTDLEMEDEDADMEIKVKVKEEEQDIEIRDSQDDPMAW